MEANICVEVLTKATKVLLVYFVPSADIYKSHILIERQKFLKNFYLTVLVHDTV
jgi:hypothetical protein